MTHTEELDTLERRLRKTGWVLVERETQFFNTRDRVIGDIDLLMRKRNYVGMNYIYIEEKSGRLDRRIKATKQIERGKEYIEQTYRPDRLFCFYAHKQDIIKIGEVYER